MEKHFFSINFIYIVDVKSLFVECGLPHFLQIKSCVDGRMKYLAK